MCDERCRRFIDRCLLLDLETTRDGRLRRIGAVYRDRTFQRKGRFDNNAALRDLDDFAAGAELLLGHNLLGHDIPYLDARAPDLDLLRRPVVDTLCLSPLAFPKRPYHPLIKSYKDHSLEKQTDNDPVADARLAAQAFEREWEEFHRMAAQGDPALALYRHFVSSSAPRNQGLAIALDAVGAPAISNAAAAREFGRLAAPQACRAAVAAVAIEVGAGATAGPALAYCLAWLRVSGSNSILPHWVRHQFPDVARLVRRLRDIPCNQAACAYCAEVHDARRQLSAFFGHEAFVPVPAAPDGGSLQEAIVRAGMVDRPLLAILPTGGGKSIGYQLPALIRNRRRGALTIVVSPLQALMKDQVDNLNRASESTLAAALYGMLTPPERAQVLAGIHMGEIAILYVSPEQLRNRTFRTAIRNREIGCWVFDEAHCLSQWGHDFRPDYLYASRFIREFAAEQGVPPPPVACFTATAKRDVRDEILTHFREQLGQELLVFAAGVKRENLHFEVQPVDPAARLEAVRDLLREAQAEHPQSGFIVYCATRANTENTAEFLRREGLDAACFHAGLEAPEKRRIQEAFVGGALPIICATNAFGMGIDKPDVRLVIHADVPGTLENYLQEAGRAGRDRAPARCVLLYCEPDIETQFRLLSMSRLAHRDMTAIWRGLRQRVRNHRRDEIVLTTSELLRDEQVDTGFDAADRNADTLVKTAVAWLERSGFVQRDENATRVFQGRPRVPSLDAARRRIDALRPPVLPAVRQRWLALLQALMNAAPDEGLSADELALRGDVHHTLPPEHPADGRTHSLMVMDAFLKMAQVGLISDGVQCTAFVRWQVVNPSRLVFERVVNLDIAMIEALREESPDAELKRWQPLSLRRLNQRLVDAGHESTTEGLQRLLKSLEWDGRGLAREQGTIDLRYVARDQYAVRLQQSWQSLMEVAERRRATAGVALRAILDRVPAEQTPSADVLVSFSIGDIADALAGDLLLKSKIRDPQRAIERALMFLHEQRVIILQQGLAVFRQAMTIRVPREAHRLQWTSGRHEPIARHEQERVFQVHVMAEYARLGLARMPTALAFVDDYFAHEKSRFVREWFAGRNEMIERATTQESYHCIVEALRNPTQAAIVAARPGRNLLVLAGPGAGKTRVVVHRIAYLIRVHRVPPRAILALAFNRNAALEVRRRLRELIGDDARGVTVLTYHGLALRLTGRSLTPSAERRDAPPDFEALLDDALRIFAPGGDALDGDEARDRVLAGYSHILIDEYQDIDDRQYRLIAALAGRTEPDSDRKLAILAVGDDDQNIYSFREANVEFIRRFQTDYQARQEYLVENFRSTAHVVAAANQLIARNRDRMKNDHPIRVDRHRVRASAGGEWAARDPVARGRVQILSVSDRAAQAAAIRDEILRLRKLQPQLEWDAFAVIARHRADLDPVRTALEGAAIPVRWTLSRDKLPPILRVREIAAFLDALRDRRDEQLDGDALDRLLAEAAPGAREDNLWRHLLGDIVEAALQDAGGRALPAREVLDFAIELLLETRRQQAIGRGVLLSTIHGAKGMEFPHVFIPDAGALSEGKKGSIEEERRTLYVAMTRAKETLCLVRRRDTHNPLLDSLEGDCFLAREVTGARRGESLARRYELLELTDMYVDFAAQQPAGDSLHEHLRALQPGDAVTLAERQGRVVILDEDGVTVGMLSRGGAERLRSQLRYVASARVICVVRRGLQDLTEGYTASRPSWEVPVVELCLRT